MKENRYDGFFYNFTIYSITMVIASVFPFLVRMISSLFIETPSVIKTDLDASYLFNSVYPIVCILTLAAFIIGGYVACYFTGYKIGFKTRTEQSKKRIKMQIIFCGIFVYLWNMFFGVFEGYSGYFGFQFWYPAALTGKLLGLFDISNMLSNIDKFDIANNNFIITGLNNTIGFVIFCYSLILSVLFTWASYRGRISGEKDGIKAKNMFAEEVKKDNPAGK
jgi:hypothetical protein